MFKHTELINTLIGCVGGLGLIAGLLRYVDDWREKRTHIKPQGAKRANV